MPNNTSTLTRRTAQIQEQLQALSSRDLQLWSIAALVILSLTAAVCAFFIPHLAWKLGTVEISGRYLPQLLFALVAMVVLFNLYVVVQKNTLHSTRQLLVQELILNERLENLSLIDPLTQLLNRRAIPEMLAREVSRCNRMGTDLTFMLIGVVGVDSINARCGRESGDQVVVQAAQLVRATFRGSDSIFRYAADEFLVAMDDTSETQADCAVQRLIRHLDNWNVTNKNDYELAITWVLTTYVPGEELQTVLDRAQRKMNAIQQRNCTPIYV